MIGANAPASNAPAEDPKETEQRGHEPSMEEILASIRRIISDDQMLPLSPRASVPPLSSNRWERAPASRTGVADAQHEPYASVHVPNQGDTIADSSAPDANPDLEAHDDHQEDDVLDLAEVAHPEDKKADDLAHDLAHEVTPHVGTATASHDARPAARVSHAAREDAVEDPAAADRAPAAAGPSPMLAAALPGQHKHAEREHEPIVSDDTVSSVSAHFQQLAATMLLQNFPPVDQIARELLRPMIKTWLDDNLPVMVERLVRAEIERVARVGR